MIDALKPLIKQFLPFAQERMALNAPKAVCAPRCR